jgi:hypothetical protein
LCVILGAVSDLGVGPLIERLMCVRTEYDKFHSVMVGLNGYGEVYEDVPITELTIPKV